MVTALNMI